MKPTPKVDSIEGLSVIKKDHRPEWAVIKWIDAVNESVLTILSSILGALACLGIAQVVARYIFKSPIAWSEEVIRFALIWCVFLGAGVVARKGMLIAVEVIYVALPPAAARLVAHFSLGICIIFWSVLVYFGWTVSGMVGSLMSGSLELPMRYVYLAIPVGAFFALVNTIIVAFDPPPTVIVQAAS